MSRQRSPTRNWRQGSERVFSWHSISSRARLPAVALLVIIVFADFYRVQRQNGGKARVDLIDFDATCLIPRNIRLVSDDQSAESVPRFSSLSASSAPSTMTSSLRLRGG